MLQGYSAFISHFRQLAADDAGLADFVVGGSDRILSRETSIIDYPVLWMTYPEISAQPGGEDMRWQYNIQLWVLTNAPADDWEQEDANLDAMLTICQRIVRTLYADATERNLFEFNPTTISLLPKPKFSGDNDQGWVLEFDLLTHANLC